MFVAKSSVITTASPEAVWKVWADVNNWSSWDPDVKSCEMKEEFKKGAKAILKPTSGPSVNIEIVECIALKSFVSISYLPLWTTLIFEHKMKQVEGGLKITHRVELQGCAAPLFNYFLGGSIQKGLPGALNNLADRATKVD